MFRLWHFLRAGVHPAGWRPATVMAVLVTLVLMLSWRVAAHSALPGGAFSLWSYSGPILPLPGLGWVPVAGKN